MTTLVIYPVSQEKAGRNQYIFITHIKQHTDDNVATYVHRTKDNTISLNNSTEELSEE